MRREKSGVSASPIVVDDVPASQESNGGSHSLREVVVEDQELLSFVDFGDERVERVRTDWMADRLEMTWKKEDGSEECAIMQYSGLDAVLVMDALSLVALQGCILGDETHERFKTYNPNRISKKMSGFVVLGFASRAQYDFVVELVMQKEVLFKVHKIVFNKREWVRWEHYSDKKNRGEVKRSRRFRKAEEDVVLMYPRNERDVVTIYSADVALLKQGAFLNDSIIAFYVKFLQHAVVPFAQANGLYFKRSVHIYSSFFFHKLQDQGYKAVKKWVSEVDIFSKDFLVIPINEEFHRNYKFFFW